MLLTTLIFGNTISTYHSGHLLREKLDVTLKKNPFMILRKYVNYTSETKDD